MSDSHHPARFQVFDSHGWVRPAGLSTPCKAVKPVCDEYRMPPWNTIAFRITHGHTMTAAATSETIARLVLIERIGVWKAAQTITKGRKIALNRNSISMPAQVPIATSGIQLSFDLA
jgi:hypothetical protein